MEPLALTFAVLALGLGVLSVWLLRERYRLTAERDVARARIGDEERVRTSFEALAGDALKSSNQEFLRLAKETLGAREARTLAQMDERRKAIDELVLPIRSALEKTREEITKVERGHLGLREQVEAMHRSNRTLREETGRLVQALRKPNVRGRYGEIQLERVVELAGMRPYCDFTPQENLRDGEGRLRKPDLVVRLPNERVIAIDAKTSIDSYVDALDAATPEEADAHLVRYAEHVVVQAQKLARKEYWTHFEGSPEFVVMFIPGDQLVDAALERRPDLIELAAERNVVLASPSTLIGLLRAVHTGWREKSLSENAAELFRLGRELHERAGTVLGHADRLGEALQQAQGAYNRFVASVDARLVPTLRKFEERGARSAKGIEPPRELEIELRPLRSLREIEDDLPAPSAEDAAG